MRILQLYFIKSCPFWRSDIPSKVYIVNLNQQKESSEKFILEDLDDTHLFVQPTIVEWLKVQLKEFQDQNTYQPPRKGDI